MNSEQYIKRSRQLYESSKLSLVHWTFKHLEFSAMADPSFHGKERVVAVIKHLNPNRYYYSGFKEYEATNDMLFVQEAKQSIGNIRGVSIFCSQANLHYVKHVA